MTSSLSTLEGSREAIAEFFRSELTRVVVYDNRGHLHSVVYELVAQPRRRLVDYLPTLHHLLYR